jgi:hypothetical protein
VMSGGKWVIGEGVEGNPHAPLTQKIHIDKSIY